MRRPAAADSFALAAALALQDSPRAGPIEEQQSCARFVGRRHDPYRDDLFR
jgi:hypothetical protein